MTRAHHANEIGDAEHYTKPNAQPRSSPATRRTNAKRGSRAFPRSVRAGCSRFRTRRSSSTDRHSEGMGAAQRLDFGWDHPFGAVNIAWDRDADVIYVTKTYREREATPIIHAAAIKPWGDWIPCAWPHDGYQHDKGSGEGLPAVQGARAEHAALSTLYARGRRQWRRGRRDGNARPDADRPPQGVRI
jgi:hypothetical protein